MRLDRIERKRLLGHDRKDRTVGTGELGTRVLEQDSWSRTAGAGKECWSRKAGAGQMPRNPLSGCFSDDAKV
jgi:hypothetical protein